MTYLVNGNPVACLEVHHAQYVARDGRAAVVVRLLPRHLDVLGPHLVGLKVLGALRHIEHVDKARSLLFETKLLEQLLLE